MGGGRKTPGAWDEETFADDLKEEEEDLVFQRLVI